jgi:rifampin ADP-ribosylating transferase
LSDELLVRRSSPFDGEPTERHTAVCARRANYCRHMSATGEPVPFEVYEPGVYLHGTKADLAVGDMLAPGRQSNFEAGRAMNHVYFTATLDAAVWGAELAAGEGRGRVYIVEPRGEFEDDPNVTNKRFPGNPTQSFRSREPLHVVGELVDWVGHSPEKLQSMRHGLNALKRQGTAQIED